MAYESVENLKQIESWFNIITPNKGNIFILKKQIDTLRDKEWSKIYQK